MKATGAGLAGAGLTSVTGTAGAAGLNIAPLVRDGNQIVDPQGEEVTLRGVSIADPGEQSRTWRGMDASQVFDMATSHNAFSNTIVRVPMQSEFIATGSAAASGPDASALPHGDDWGPAMPGTYGPSQLEGYLDGLIDDLVDQAEQNGAYIMLDYHRHFPVFHHHEHEEYVNDSSGSPLDDPCYDDITNVWQCTDDSDVDHTQVDGSNSDFDVRPTLGRDPNVCGERGILWHGEDQVEDVLQLAEDQAVWEDIDTSETENPPEGIDDIYTEPAGLSNAMDNELQQFWEIVADRYSDRDCVVFDIYNEPTGPYAGDWGGPERVAGALSETQIPDDRYELWGEYAKPYYDLWRDRSQPWVTTAENNGQGQVMTIGNPRWSQYVYWAPYNEHDAENMAYTSHVYLQENCRPLETTVGQPSEQVPIFFSEFGWMDFDLTVPTPWMDGGMEWATGTTDPTGGMSFGEFIDNFPVHPICWAFDHTWEPNFFRHGCPGGGERDGSTGAVGESHWYDDGDWLFQEDTPGQWWTDFVNQRDTSVSSGSDYYPNADTGPNSLNCSTDGYASDVISSTDNSYSSCDTEPDCDTSTTVDGQTVCDVNGDGYYRDVNGDAQVSQADVTDFFEVQHRSAWKQPSLFDFDGSGSVSHGDVVDLFEYAAVQ